MNIHTIGLLADSALGNTWSDIRRFEKGLLDGVNELTGLGLSTNSWIPRVNVSETKTTFNLHFQLPGIKKEDVTINVDKNVLTVSGDTSRTTQTENVHWHRVETQNGSFTRSLTLPEGTDTDNIVAEFDNGMLNITLPKPQQIKSTSKKIPIRTTTSTST